MSFGTFGSGQSLRVSISSVAVSPALIVPRTSTHLPARRQFPGRLLRQAQDRLSVDRVQRGVETDRWHPCALTVGDSSVRFPLKLPRCFECILDGTRVASRKVRDDHHVLDVPGRHAEGFGELAQYPVSVVEI